MTALKGFIKIHCVKTDKKLGIKEGEVYSGELIENIAYKMKIGRLYRILPKEYFKTSKEHKLSQQFNGAISMTQLMDMLSNNAKYDKFSIMEWNDFYYTVKCYKEGSYRKEIWVKR